MLSNQKAKKELNWNPRLNFDETIKLTVDWYKSFFLNRNLEITTEEQIEYYSNNDKERMKIAKNGRDKYFKYFNSTAVADFIIKKAFSEKHKKFYWE